MTSSHQLIRYLILNGFLNEVPHERTFVSESYGPLYCLEQNRLCSELAALTFLSEKLSLPVVSLEVESASGFWSPQELVARITPEICRKHQFLPYKEQEDCIFVATGNPLDEDARQIIEFVFQKNCRFVLSTQEEITTFLADQAPETISEYDTFSGIESTASIEIINPKHSPVITDDAAESAPIVRLCNKIIADAIDHNASDIHLEPNENGLAVRFRVNGTMSTIFLIPKRLQSYVTARFKVLSNMDISDRRRPQDGRARARINGKQADIRVSSIPTAHGEKLVLRMLSTQSYAQTFESLGMPAHCHKPFTAELGRHGRMLLVTGPTGSGKSTTLYTALNHIQDGTLNIATVEDPVEFKMKGINQMQVNEAAGVTFTSALRSLLRQDPDVIMIGEIRDIDTATIALQAAQTGHLVLSTLHTNDAIAAIRRMEQLGCPPYLVGSSIAGIIAQRLLRTACSNCVRPMGEGALAAAIEHFESAGVDVQPEQIIECPGCDYCHGTGYTGRQGIYSYLQINGEMEELIFQGASSAVIRKLAIKHGHTELHEEAITLMQAGKTTYQEVLPYLQLAQSHREESGQVPKVEQPTTLAPAEKKANPTETNLKKRKLLLIEDDETVRTVLSMLLQKEMFEVIEAENGMDGLEKLYAHNPSLILCDLMMPVMDGKDFLVRVKNNEDTAHIPVIMLTAADTENNEVQLLELGASDFVSKASNSAILLTRLRKATASL